MRQNGASSSGELLGAHWGELFDLDGEHPRFDVPLKRVMKRRVIAFRSGCRDHFGTP